MRKPLLILFSICFLAIPAVPAVVELVETPLEGVETPQNPVPELVEAHAAVTVPELVETPPETPLETPQNPISAVDSKLNEYLSAIARLSPQEKIAECDFLLETCNSDSLRNITAQKLYTHFLASPVMGDDAVSVYLTDNWFAKSKVSFASDAALLTAKVHADFNRASLLGCRAPSLQLFSPDGLKHNVLAPADSSFAAVSSRYRVLFFYSPDCPKCKMQTILLNVLLREKSYPIDFIAVNTGANKEEWISFIDSNFENYSNTAISHYWDPDVSSDYQRKYGILQTPRLFLIDKQGFIIGRGLDAAALQSLLETYLSKESREYGSAESAQFFDALFTSLGTDLTADDIKSVADKLEESAGELYCQLTGDLLYWLAGRSGAEYKYGTQYVAREKVLNKPEYWKTEDDSAKVVAFADALDKMISRSPLGSELPALTVRGKMLKHSASLRNPETSISNILERTESRKWKLNKIRSAYIVFYSEGCPNCEAQKSGIQELLLNNRKAKLLMIDMDEMMSTSSQEAYQLLDAFDLSQLPYITLIDSHRLVAGKYLSFVK